MVRWMRFGAVLAIISVVIAGFPAGADEGGVSPQEIGLYVRASVSGTLTEDNAAIDADTVVIDAPWMSSRVKIDQDWLEGRLGAWSAGVPFTVDPQGRAVTEGDEDVEFRAWAPSSSRAFTWGSTDSVRFSDRPMWLSLERGENGSYVLDMDDGDSSGQQVFIAKQWLWNLGMHRATVSHEDGYALDVTPSYDGTGYWIDVPHFTEVQLNPADLSVKGKQGLVVSDHPGERRWDAVNQSLEVDVGTYSSTYELMVEKDWVDQNIDAPFNNSHASTTTTWLETEYYTFALSAEQTPAMIVLAPEDDLDTRQLLAECHTVFETVCGQAVEDFIRDLCNGLQECDVGETVSGWHSLAAQCASSSCTGPASGFEALKDAVDAKLQAVEEECGASEQFLEPCSTLTDVVETLRTAMYGAYDLSLADWVDPPNPKDAHELWANDAGGEWELLYTATPQEVDILPGTYRKLAGALPGIPDAGFFRQFAEYAGSNPWVNDGATSNLVTPVVPADEKEVEEAGIACALALTALAVAIAMAQPWGVAGASVAAATLCSHWADIAFDDGIWGGTGVYTNCWGALCDLTSASATATIWRGEIIDLGAILALTSDLDMSTGATSVDGAPQSTAAPYENYHRNRGAYEWQDTQEQRPAAHAAWQNFGLQVEEASASIQLELPLVTKIVEDTIQGMELGSSSVGRVWLLPVSMSIIVECPTTCSDSAILEVNAAQGTGILTPGATAQEEATLEFQGETNGAVVHLLGLTISGFTLNGEFVGSGAASAPEQ